MRSLFQVGFEKRRFEHAALGQLDWLAPLISAGIQAGASVYGSHMQKLIAEQQKRTAEQLQAKQEAQAKAQADAQAKLQAQQQAAGAAGATGAAGPVGTAGAAPTIFGIDRNLVIIGGVGMAVVFGIVAIMLSKKKSGEEK
jgi:hypothetical protein